MQSNMHKHYSTTTKSFVEKETNGKFNYINNYIITKKKTRPSSYPFW